MRWLQRGLFAFVLVLAMPAHAATTPPVFDREHAAWSALVKKHVHWSTDGTASSVDYPGFQRDRVSLATYLDGLAGVSEAQYQTWSWPDREAFLLNAYNAATVQLVLTRFPTLGSIKDLGSWISTPWQRPFVRLLGKTRSLDDIEHKLLRGSPDFRDPRIHFAVNCASLGCPALRDEAYVGTRLDTQLNDQARRFLGDRTRNRIVRASGRLQVSRLFDWYSADFARRGGVPIFLVGYADALDLTPGETAALRAGRMRIDYLPYDWALNRSRP
ncbi:MAG: DUF547 domain-containing protein [Pseudoxanthomonas sp.]